MTTTRERLAEKAVRLAVEAWIGGDMAKALRFLNVFSVTSPTKREEAATSAPGDDGGGS